ncbi:MAG: protein TolR [Rhodospirillaceae bacterium]|jgi:biopolymer transport protein TolR|nr:protein TolR [Rhodospirillaceae bacterium]MBT3629222.1 protein TolR [Rhodospirillaceae bacterium]MBT3928095.1 protein TolR [Rhodospirillaceae bacterium]MBT5039438.1 protein TolR [Rhodospirillaceae bacterium]MBT5781174.1 protein TolR [Rhodospirillaceae bacterium]
MGAELQHGVSRRRRRGRAPMSQINVTPFVDVMLVLLVIFMITAPLLTVGVQVDLPETEAGPISGDDEPLSISITKDNVIFLQETEVELGDLVPKLMAISDRRTDMRIFLRADEAIPYGQVMQVMGTVNRAGFKKVALVTKLEKEAK